MISGHRSSGHADLFAVLRESTADLHERLEARLALADPDLTLDRYADAVGVLAASTLAVEAALQRVFDVNPQLADRLDWPARRKTDLFVRDLHGLGRRLPLCVSPPSLDGCADAVGAMYVLEGATLGGNVVDTLIRRRLGSDTPRASFRPYGDQFRQRWTEFRQQATTLLADQPVDGAIDASRRVFELFNDVATAVGLIGVGG
ncbi:MAG TPA: biliverdin-producing heme oxygenase [Ilumatobacteraceae bacterium]|nr:biliverdin-producing heme oxygenase [Ilumatobacteraceae bacterium]